MQQLVALLVVPDGEAPTSDLAARVEALRAGVADDRAVGPFRVMFRIVMGLFRDV